MYTLYNVGVRSESCDTLAFMHLDIGSENLMLQKDIFQEDSGFNF